MTGPEEFDFGWQAVKMAGNLALVVAILFAGFYALKRWGKWMRQTGAGAWIEVLAQHPLGPKHTLMVVKVEERRMLIGISPQGVHLLADLSGAAPGASGPTDDSPADAPR
jgi:flagellar protein FliO/FliZ